MYEEGGNNSLKRLRLNWGNNDRKENLSIFIL